MARPSRLNITQHAQERHQPVLLALPNVVGVATGFRMKGAELTEEVCVQVFVQRKLAEDQLKAWETVPPRLEGLDGARVRTDVIEAPTAEAHQDTTRYRPVPGGCSIGPEASTSAGTLGGWACDDTDDTIVLLSNNHVISNLDNLPVLRRVVQPGRLDGGRLPDDVIGTLKRHQVVNTVANPPTVPVPLSVVDAAISTIVVDRDDDVLAIGPAVYELRAPALGMNVQKRGRTTGLTTNGRITSINATFGITYRNRTRISSMQNAFRITSTDGNNFSAAGDSGSLVFDQAAGRLNGTRPVVGLLYGGGTFNNGTPFTDANDINAVFGALNLTTVCTCVARALIRALFSRDAGERSAGSAAEARLRRLRTTLMKSPVGTDIEELVGSEAGRIGRLLAADDEAFGLAVRLLSPLADSATNLDLLETQIDRDMIDTLSRFADSVGARVPEAGERLSALHRALDAVEGSTMDQVLRIAAKEIDQRPSKTGRGSTRRKKK